MTTNDFETVGIRRRNFLLWIIGSGLLFPLFFQLSGRIYNSVKPVWDSGGVLSQVPLPVSLLACCCGLFLLAAKYRRAAIALKVAAAMALFMVLSLMLAGPEIELRKVILLMQVLLPLAGLVLGQLVDDEDQIIPRAFLMVLLLIVPAQLLRGWLQGNFALTHYMYVFSIYQHFQYVPLILVCGFAYSMSILWDIYKKTFYFLIPLMYIYALESLSMLTIFALVAFVVAFAFVRLKGFKKIQVIILIGVAVIGMQAYFAIMEYAIMNDKTGSYLGAGQYAGKFQFLEQGEKPRNVTDRLGDWKLYSGGIIESTKTVFLGHPAPFPREVKTSAHNWYLDMTYNFGVISLLPVIFLSGYTLYLLWQRRKKLPTAIFWLAAIVFYLVIVDSNFKVTLRQPYSGIFAYFVWGMLLSRLKYDHLKLEN
jgi:hypothetical protein